MADYEDQSMNPLADMNRDMNRDVDTDIDDKDVQMVSAEEATRVSSSATIKQEAGAPATPQGLQQTLQREGVLESMDKNGDMIIFVGRAKFLCCSRTIFRASRVLEKAAADTAARLAEGGEMSRDAIALQSRRITLKARPGVTPAAVRAVLTIIHGSPMELSSQFGDRKLLHEMLIVGHYYEMTESLAPVAVKFIKKCYSPAMLFRQDEIASQLWICHQMGHLEGFKQTLGMLIMGARVNKKDQLVGSGAPDDQPYAEMEIMKLMGLMNRITSARNSLTSRLIELFEESYERLEASPGTATSTNLTEFFCLADRNQARCDLVMFGALAKAMKAADWENMDFSCSPRTLQRSIMKIGKDALERANATGIHSQCTPLLDDLDSIKKLAKEVVDRIPLEMDYFSRRGGALGFNDD
ncbi:hypothetical protein B0H67DRAFT_606496 [Lasiosphaeris hirsuta]|uniref:Uncharacterized protein n=1 Tax=Lasiosphaeris hirsuta TaxID=260670 RepID=A0AA40BD14_9PEZI|nr:hypothetical protein B0H67DRAFT_606496 [Lasiosphaeris hirsuta]